MLVACLTLTSASVHAAPALLLFGGSDHKTFLGCLNCSPTDSVSICNDFGKHGSSFSSQSIWNSFGAYGSTFSSESPWNSFASYPPVIVDKEGGFYGYFTSNTLKDKRTNIKALQTLAELGERGGNLDKVRDAFCR